MTVPHRPADRGVSWSEADSEALRRFGALVQRVAGTSGRLTPRDAFERLQRIVRIAFEAMASHHGVEAPDATFYDQLRAAMVEAGAIEADLDALVYWLVCAIVDWTSPGSEERAHQFELITRHLVRADMTVRIRPGDTHVRVEFPDRPTRH